MIALSGPTTICVWTDGGWVALGTCSETTATTIAVKTTDSTTLDAFRRCVAACSNEPAELPEPEQLPEPFSPPRERPAFDGRSDSPPDRTSRPKKQVSVPHLARPPPAAVLFFGSERR